MSGLEAQLARRRELLAAGARAVGWKVGFGSPEALARLGLEGPLVGFLVDTALVEDGAAVSLAGWTRPVLEPEVAVWVGPAASIAGLGAAIELADLDVPPDDPERILAANVYQRHVVLGVRGPALEPAALSARVTCGGDERLADDVEALTGRLDEVVAHVARTLDAAGEELREGEVVIAGSVVPPLEVRPGDRVRYELKPLGTLELTLVG
ncbi:MAG TPA: fumarylacetoacetate hydrolase family protein [Gaiellaceae bacterium]|nr:fumarylacetoacetate hydrolase family protein [Gaiellaceae bacterium]